MMSTPNMSFDSPIVVTKSDFCGMDKQKDAVDSSTKPDNQTDSKDAKLEEDKRSKKKDMFAPEADMFAEEYSVSFLFDYSIKCAHLQFSLPNSSFKSCRLSLHS